MNTSDTRVSQELGVASAVETSGRPKMMPQ